MKIHFQINQKVCDEVHGSEKYVGQPQRGLGFSQRGEQMHKKTLRTAP